MIEIMRAAIIGVVQGVSEFLPISSSGHLVLIPYVFKWNYQGLAFDTALHFGTALAIVIFFWRDWLEIITAPFHKKPAAGQYPKDLLWHILVASIPAAIIGIAINDYVESTFHSPLLIAFDLVFFGWLLWYVDQRTKKSLSLSKISYQKSFLIGLAQSVALIPGVSRSGITMTSGRALGLDRPTAARYSFLIGTPAMLGAFFLEARKLSGEELAAPFWVGVICATIFGFTAIKYLLEYLKKSDFAIFLWYRVIIAALVLTIYLWR